LGHFRTPCYDQIRSIYPWTTLAASGVSIGLSESSPGDAEAGHRTLGSGRALLPEAARINDLIRDGAIADSDVVRRAFGRASASGADVHLIGMLSDAGVHSSPESLFSLLRVAKSMGLANVFVHAILDGRDVPTRTADVYVEALEIKMADIGVGQIASLCGRFFAMDTGMHWERTARAFTMLVHGEGERTFDAVTAVRSSFLRGISDEFIAPVVVEKRPDEPMATVKDGDVVVFFNHDPASMRQLVRSLAVPDEMTPKPRIEAICLTEYDPELRLPAVFEPAREPNTLASVLDDHGIENYRITETSRAMHLSDHFNSAAGPPASTEFHLFHQTGGTGDIEFKPESKSFKVADSAIEQMAISGSGVFMINLPAAAIAARTGNFERTVEAIQYVDTCLGGIVDQVNTLGGSALITASHGGCERVGPAVDRSPEVVPVHFVGSQAAGTTLSNGGSLQDISPTLLGILGIPQPPEMTGRDLRMPR
jgi:2,3-bisphosphoglycerate-independent phosphoglycerate mutase